MRVSCIPLILGLILIGRANAARPVFTSYASAEPILHARREFLPAESKDADAARWTAWTRSQDKAIRNRLQQGDLDSMVNLLLFGTSFTTRPRIHIESIVEASRSGTVRGRVNDFVTAIRESAGNERFVFLNGLLQSKGVDPADPGAAGVFLYKNLQRVLEERRVLANRAEQATRVAASPLDRFSLFEERGVSLDTGIFPNYAIEQALRDLKRRDVVHEGEIARVAVIGPGLDFADKNEESAFDYYPQQSLQPFALLDSLVRLGLARINATELSVLDISPRVIDHFIRARERARRNTGYLLQLPHDISRRWPRDLIAYWRSLGEMAGMEVPPIRPPSIFQDLETRAVRIRPAFILACRPVNLNIVVERLSLSEPERFDLIVGTNIFLYYDAFQQMLALENAGAMLKPGGILLTNDLLPEVPGGLMLHAGTTEVRFDDDASAREVVGWYRRK